MISSPLQSREASHISLRVSLLRRGLGGFIKRGVWQEDSIRIMFTVWLVTIAALVVTTVAQSIGSFALYT